MLSTGHPPGEAYSKYSKWRGTRGIIMGSVCRWTARRMTRSKMADLVESGCWRTGRDEYVCVADDMGEGRRGSLMRDLQIQSVELEGSSCGHLQSWLRSQLLTHRGSVCGLAVLFPSLNADYDLRRHSEWQGRSDVQPRRDTPKPPLYLNYSVIKLIFWLHGTVCAHGHIPTLICERWRSWQILSAQVLHARGVAGPTF